MKYIVGIILFLGLAATAADFVTVTEPPVPQKKNHRLQDSFTLTEGQTITLTADGQQTRTFTVPTGKTAFVAVHIQLVVQ